MVLASCSTGVWSLYLSCYSGAAGAAWRQCTCRASLCFRMDGTPVQHNQASKQTKRGGGYLVSSSRWDGIAKQRVNTSKGRNLLYGKNTGLWIVIVFICDADGTIWTFKPKYLLKLILLDLTIIFEYVHPSSAYLPIFPSAKPSQSQHLNSVHLFSMASGINV